VLLAAVCYYIAPVTFAEDIRLVKMTAKLAEHRAPLSDGWISLNGDVHPGLPIEQQKVLQTAAAAAAAAAATTKHQQQQQQQQQSLQQHAWEGIRTAAPSGSIVKLRQEGLRLSNTSNNIYKATRPVHTTPREKL